MCGGGLGKILNNPITKIASDVAAVATGNPELIPFINAGETAAGNKLSGQSWGKSLGQGAISGGTALAGQELLGAVGIGGGNSLVNNALGVDISPAATGLPDIGSALESGFRSTTDALGFTTPTPTTSPGVGSAPGSISAPSSTSAGAAAGGAPGGAAATAAPSTIGADLSTDQLSNLSPVSTGTSLTAQGGSNIGTQSIGSSISPSLANAVNSTTASGAGNFFGAPNPGLTNLTSSFAPSTGSSIASAAAEPTGVMGAIKSIIGPNASPLGLGISGAGLAASAIQGNKTSGAEKNLQADAGRLDQQGSELQSYLKSGTLPPGLQQSINQASQSAKASIKSRYASMGMSGSSAEQQELASVDSNAQAKGAEIAMQLLNTGINETGMASQLYHALLGEQMKEDEGLGKAISSFAQAAGGGVPQGRIIQIGA